MTPALRYQECSNEGRAYISFKKIIQTTGYVTGGHEGIISGIPVKYKEAGPIDG